MLLHIALFEGQKRFVCLSGGSKTRALNFLLNFALFFLGLNKRPFKGGLFAQASLRA